MWNKLLYYLFGKRILKVYFNSQSKKQGFDKMKKAFVDSNGMTYYTPENDFDYSVKRSKEMQKRLVRVNSGLDDNEIDTFIEALEKACNNGKSPDIARIFFLIGEMKARKDIWIHEDLWFDILAIRYIREDENPATIDINIHREKIEQFKKDSEAGLYDFFYNMGLTKSIPYLEKLESDFDIYIDKSRAKIQAHRKTLKAYLTGQS